MKRTVVVLVAVLLLVSPLPHLAQGQHPTSEPIPNCPIGVAFVGNYVADLHTSPACTEGEFYWTRDGIKITGSSGLAFYRDAGLAKGSTYTYGHCCDNGIDPPNCHQFQQVTLGEISGDLCQDLAWSGGVYDYPTGGVDVIKGAALTVSGATLRNLDITNETSSESTDQGGDIRIEGSTLDNVWLYFGAPGNSYLNNSTLLHDPPIDRVHMMAYGNHLSVRKNADVTISGNTFYTLTININGGADDADPGPRATISYNTFHASNVNIFDARSVTTTILGNRFYWDHSRIYGASIYQDGSSTLIANNTFLRRGNADRGANAIRVGNSYDDPEISTISHIENNTISDFNLVNEKGILLYGRVDEATITGNTITENATGIYISNYASATVQDNCIAGNSTGLHGLTASVDARNNWWGDPSGPTNYLNPGGTGDSIGGGLGLFDPWLTTDNCSTEPPAILTLTLPPDPLPADGATQIYIHADLSDEQGPVAGATVDFAISPSLGQLWPASVATDSQGQATVHYLVPSPAALGAGTQVTVSASSGTASDSGALTFRTERPSINRVQVVGIGTLNDVPETGRRVAIIVDYTETAGYEVFDLVITSPLLGTPVHQSGPSDDQFTYVYLPPTGPGQHGEEKVQIALGYRHTATGKAFYHLVHYRFNLFFARDGDHDGDEVPNWFEYWAADGAVPALKEGAAAGTVVYNATLGSSTGGAFFPSTNEIMLGPRAARDDPGLSIEYGPGCRPDLHAPPTQGIDTPGRVIGREVNRFWVYHFWTGGAAWNGKQDSDDMTPKDKLDDLFPADNLPDSIETRLGTLPNDVDSCNLAAIHWSYGLNGDQEIYCLKYAPDLSGVSDNDWANPGTQAGGLGATVMAAPLLAAATASTSGPAVGVSPANSPHLPAAQPEFASLTGVYSDAGVDSDGDTLHDQLRLSVGLAVSQEEIYNVVAWLKGGSGTQIGWAATQATLSPGGHTLDLLFDGQLIRESGLDGPYTVNVVELRLGPRELLLAAPQDAHTTAAYGLADFDPPDIAFTGAFSDQGVDSGSDGLYDQLRIDVGLDVQESGTYTITGELSGTHPIVVSQAAADLAIGAQTLSLDFHGASIYHNRQDGPYQLRALRVEDASGNQVDFLLDAYATGSYTYGAFQHSGTTFDASTYDDQGVDADDNGRYDSLRFSLSLDVDQQDTYLLLADLTDGSGVTIHSLAREVDLAVGSHTVNLDFFGRAISGHGVDGPYTVTSLALLASDGTLVDHHPLTHTTQAYSWTDFEYTGFIYLPLVIR